MDTKSEMDLTSMEQDVLAASDELASAEMEVERIAKTAAVAKTRVKWAKINHRAATLSLRRARKSAP